MLACRLLHVHRDLRATPYRRQGTTDKPHLLPDDRSLSNVLLPHVRFRHRHPQSVQEAAEPAGTGHLDPVRGQGPAVEPRPDHTQQQPAIPGNHRFLYALL